jgi:hypothetical protein
MATTRKRATSPARAAGDALGLYRHAAGFGFDVVEASAQSFIRHQVEVANLKRALTKAYFDAARAALK